MSDSKVVELSRNFVCARLLTYESAEEAKVLTRLFRGRTGELENTVFAMLAPDGVTQLCRPSRSPAMTFGRRDTAAALAAAMAEAIAAYPGNAEASKPPAVPYHLDVRRGLAAAAADIRPLLVVRDTATDDAAIEQAVAPLVWSKAFAGRFSVARAAKQSELAAITGALEADGIMVVAPNDYGTRGTVIAKCEGFAGDRVRAALANALESYKPGDKAWHTLMREGRRAGVERWKTVIPVTDPGPGGRDERRGRRRR